MPSKGPVEIKSVGSQSDRRALVTYRDQHKNARFPDGRPWWGYVEMPSNPQDVPGCVCELQPGDHEDPFGSTWVAPWMPHAKYLDINHRKGTVRIAYQRMITDYKTAMERHYQKATEVAYEKNWPVPTWLGPIDHNIAFVIGAMPQSPKIPEAALAGDPWLLGFSPEPNEKLAKLIAQSVQSDMWDVPEALAIATPTPAMDQAAFQAAVDTAVEAALASKAAKRMEKVRAGRKPTRQHASPATASGS